MSFINTFQFADSSVLDAFSRLRISQINQLLDTKFTFDKQPLIWEEDLIGGADAATHNTSDSTITLATDADTEAVVRQTKPYFIYRSGQSLLITLSFGQLQPETNITKRLGYFDVNNGIFLESSDGTVKVVRRSTTTEGTIEIEQTNWNRDRLDGTGPSGITIDWTKAHILVIDLQWLGVGRVRVGLEINGQLYIVHEFEHGNSVATTYMGTGSLPVRYEIAQSGVGSGSLLQICSSVGREGALEDVGIVTSVSTEPEGIAISTTPQSILSIRNASSFIRQQTQPLAFGVSLLGTGMCRVRLVLNPTLGGALSWSAVSISGLEQSITQQTYTNGTGHVLATAFAYGDTSGGAGTDTSIPVSQAVNSVLSVVANIAGTSDILSIITDVNTGTPNANAFLTVKELG